MSHKRLALGKEGEKIAVEYLKKKGYTILEKNYTTSSGEIDIISLIDACLVFVEVKTRSGLSHGSPLAAVQVKKQQQICRVAQEYLIKSGNTDCDARFDVIGIIVGRQSSPVIEHIADAFELSNAFF